MRACVRVVSWRDVVWRVGCFSEEEHCDCQRSIHLKPSRVVDLGYIQINIDEGWFKDRDANGTMVEDFDKFPGGMKALGQWIKNQTAKKTGAHMRYGLYTSRGTCQCGTGLLVPGAFVWFGPCQRIYAVAGMTGTESGVILCPLPTRPAFDWLIDCRNVQGCWVERFREAGRRLDGHLRWCRLFEGVRCGHVCCMLNVAAVVFFFSF